MRYYHGHDERVIFHGVFYLGGRFTVDTRSAW